MNRVGRGGGGGGGSSPQWLVELDDLSDQFWRKSKRYLPLIARLCVVMMYLEDSIRTYMRWTSLSQFFARQFGVSWWFGTILVGYNLFGKLGASILILMKKHNSLACGILLSVVCAESIEYRYYRNVPIFLSRLALLGGLILFLADSWPQAHVTSASLPSVGEDKPKNMLQLLGRVMVVFMFFTLLRVRLTTIQLIYYITGIPLVLCIALGFKTKLSALILIILCALVSCICFPFWFVPSVESKHDHWKFQFFHLWSLIGSLLFLVSLGAGKVSIDERNYH